MRAIKLTTSPLLERRPLSPSPSPRRVTFQASNNAHPRNFVQSSSNARDAWSRGRTRSYNRPFRNRGMPARRVNDTPSFCNKCGRNPHANINFCPAVNKACNFCHKIGHFSRVCFAANRSRDNQD